MKKFYFNHVIALVTFFISSCVFAQYDGGIIILNEGNFGWNPPTSSVTFLKLPGFEKTDNVYQTVNNEPIGDVLQSMNFHESSAYLVVNGSNKIIKVNRSTFKKEVVITEGLNQPRYIAFAKDKAFVTNAGSKSVSIYDVNNNLLFVKDIPLNTAVEKVQTLGENVVVMQATAWGSGKKLSLISPENNEIIKTIEIANKIKDIQVYENELFVISSEYLYKFDNELNEIKSLDISSLTFSSYNTKIRVDNDKVYFNAKNELFELSTDLNELPTTPYLTVEGTGAYLYGMSVIDGILYSCNAGDYVKNSTVSMYVGSQKIYTFEAGALANGAYKNEKQPLSTKEVVLAENIVVYPNPTQGVFHLKGVEKAKVTIYSLAGQVVKTVDYTGQEIHVSDLAKGTYIVVIETSNGVTKTKLMVQ